MEKLYNFFFISRANFAVEIKQLVPTKFFWKIVYINQKHVNHSGIHIDTQKSLCPIPLKLSNVVSFVFLV